MKGGGRRRGWRPHPSSVDSGRASSCIYCLRSKESVQTRPPGEWQVSPETDGGGHVEWGCLPGPGRVVPLGWRVCLGSAAGCERVVSTCSLGVDTLPCGDHCLPDCVVFLCSRHLPQFTLSCACIFHCSTDVSVRCPADMSYLVCPHQSRGRPSGTPGPHL